MLQKEVRKQSRLSVRVERYKKATPLELNRGKRRSCFGANAYDTK